MSVAAATQSVSVSRYVLAGATVKLIGALGILLFASSNDELPNLSTPITIAAVGVGIAWYARAVDRPMTRSELLRFSTGTALVDLIYSAAWLIISLSITNLPMSYRGIDILLGGDGSNLGPADLAPLTGLTIFSLMVMFALAYFFARLGTRKLPRK